MMSIKTDKSNSNNQHGVGKRRSNFYDIWHRFKKNKMAVFGLLIIMMIIFSAIFADYIAPYNYETQNLNETLCFPSWKHPMGTDNLGRDIFSRIIYGSRISILVGFIAVGIGVTIGGTLGALASYYGAYLDTVIMRCIDVMIAIPSILLSISISAALGPGLTNVMIAVGIGAVPSYARVTRASVLTVKEQEYIEAARAIGAKDYRVILRHIIPNAISPIIVQATLGVASAILSAASLSFIGLGIEPPTPEWGSMLSAGRSYIRNYWHMVTFPGLAIMLTIFALNLFGDGVRDALDPRLKR